MAIAELERLGKKCCIAWDDFCAAVNCSANPSTADPNSPITETKKSRKGTLSASLISVRFSHSGVPTPLSWLRVGSSCVAHFSPSSLTALERMRKIPGLTSLGSADDEGAGSAVVPDISFASEAITDMLLSNDSSSIVPNESMMLASAKGRWSQCSKRTGESSLLGGGEARGIWAGVSSLATERLVPLPRCFFLTGPSLKRK